MLVELANEQTVFQTAYLDVDEHPDKARDYGVSSIPVLVFFDADGQELYRHVGFWPKNDILSRWKKLSAQTAASD